MHVYEVSPDRLVEYRSRFEFVCFLINVYTCSMILYYCKHPKYALGAVYTKRVSQSKYYFQLIQILILVVVRTGGVSGCL